ncbi:centrosomal protein of 44 kDa isoform X1 [Antechinus flavipes]|uniref:centrosomal protein of 44 kDa isoform X1 n=1 Tax=Antechinus flavipes TaxID=38775 RepID=UPI002235C014|nr:centrosomal protein of 44 kDa isoform X1 [Antechinus flavipes]XP_051821883.1 centrosomal protein of 44 kDa isoform X1 [Antechinus flavipes]
MATGDLKRSLRNLEQGIRLLGYPREVDYSGLVKGDPAAYLPIISHSLTSYSTYVAEFLVISNTELTAKNDYRFIDSVYKLLRDKFHYKPILTKKQFFQYGFVEWKIQIVCDILNLVMKKHKELCNLDKAIAQKKKIRPIKSEAFINFEKTLVEPVIPDFTFRGFPSEQKKPIVERHPNSENFSHILFSETEGNENFVEPGRDIIEITCESQDTELNAKIEDLRRMLAECQEKLKKQILIEDKLRYLEEQLKGKVIMQELDSDINFEIAEIRNILAECQEKLKKQSLIEDKLRYLEEQLKGKVIIDEMVWNNLLSRVTLLETEMLLHFKKYDVPSDSADMKEDHKYSRNRDLSSPGIEYPYHLGGFTHNNLLLEGGKNDLAAEKEPGILLRGPKKNVFLGQGDRKRREEVPESLHQQLSGYNLLLSADSSPQPNTINYFGLTEASKETTMEKIERIKKIRLPPEFEAKEIDGRKKGNRRACEIAAKEAVPS